jgi:HD-GYP domain-containing protein (c-di-GMP phosphodiesterase class II)
VADTDTAVLDAPSDDAAPEGAGTVTILSYWLSDAARTRLTTSGAITVIDDPDRIGEASLIAVSTRLPAGASADLVTDLRQRASVPIIVVVHPGGEEAAVDLLAGGASGLVAEGSEETIVAYLGEPMGGTGLLDSFEQSLDRRTHGRASGSGDRDPVTRLRGPAALAARLADGQGGSVPRLAFAQVLGIDEVTRRMSVDARDLMRRRLALQFDELCRHFRAEVFATGNGEYAVVADGLSLADFELLGNEMIAAASGFSPDRSGTLVLAVGHAGPEATSHLETLRELALRGMQHAAEYPDQGVVGAERLALSLAAGTELAAALRAIEAVEARDAYPGSHGERVARHAVAIGEVLGVAERDLLKLRLAARLHDIGKLTLDDDAAGGTAETLSGAVLEQYHTHSVRGAEMLRAAAGDEVADAVAAHHELWDGSGKPEGLAAEAIPLMARIIAVADALDRWSVNGTAPDRPTAAAVQKVVEASGAMFDPSVAEIVAKVFTP